MTLARAAFLTLGLVACGETARTDPVRVDTLSSGTVVVTNSPANPDQASGDLEIRELVRLGAPTSEDEGVTFGAVGGVEVDAEGTVYVLDELAHLVRVFGPDGEHVRDLGATRGGGPSDLDNPVELFLGLEERLWVRDSGNRRYSVFAPDGTATETFRRIAGGGGDPVLTESGVIYESVTSILDPETRLVERSFRGVVPRDGVMLPVDSIRRPEPLERPFWMVEYQATGSRAVVEGGSVGVPFTPERHDRMDPRGGYWTGTTDALRFHHISGDGDTIRIVERIAPARPVTSAQADQAVEELRERFDRRLNADPDDLPEHLPLWSDFFLDPDGRLWVERYHPPGGAAGDPRTWEIYDSTGVYLGAFALPLAGNPTPAVRRNRLVGVVRDEMNVDHVVVFEIVTERAGGAPGD